MSLHPFTETQILFNGRGFKIFEKGNGNKNEG